MRSRRQIAGRRGPRQPQLVGERLVRQSGRGAGDGPGDRIAIGVAGGGQIRPDAADVGRPLGAGRDGGRISRARRDLGPDRKRLRGNSPTRIVDFDGKRLRAGSARRRRPGESSAGFVEVKHARLFGRTGQPILQQGLVARIGIGRPDHIRPSRLNLRRTGRNGGDRGCRVLADDGQREGLGDRPVHAIGDRDDQVGVACRRGLPRQEPRRRIDVCAQSLGSRIDAVNEIVAIGIDGFRLVAIGLTDDGGSGRDGGEPGRSIGWYVGLGGHLESLLGVGEIRICHADREDQALGHFARFRRPAERLVGECDVLP